MFVNELPPLIQSFIVPTNIRRKPSGDLIMRSDEIKMVAENMLLFSGLIALYDYNRNWSESEENHDYDATMRALVYHGCQYTIGYAITILDAWQNKSMQNISQLDSIRFSQWYSQFIELYSGKKSSLFGEKQALLKLEELNGLVSPILGNVSLHDQNEIKSFEPWLWCKHDHFWILRQILKIDGNKKWKLVIHDLSMHNIMTLSEKSLGPEIGLLLKRNLGKNKNVSASDQDIGMIKPVIIENYPLLLKLSDFIVRNTEKQTHEKLWIKPYKEMLNNQISQSIDQHGCSQDLKINLMDLVVMDCIERSPVDVLLDVAASEPKQELEGYIRMLASSEEAAGSIIEDATSELVNFALHNDRWSKRQLALNVLKLMGFDVCDHTSLHGLEHIRASLNHIQNSYHLDSSSNETTGCALKVFTQVIEPLLKDIVLFYSAVTQKNLESQEWKNNCIDLKEKKGMGTFIRKLKEIIGNEKLFDILKDRIGLLTPLIDQKALKTAINEDTDYDLVIIRNWLAHDNKIYPEKRRNDAKFMFDICNRVITGAHSLINLCAPQGTGSILNELASRVYPFKLTFTLQQRHYIGFNRFSYITEIEESVSSGGKGGTFIHTKEDIKFGHVYYVTPHRNRMTTKLWMDPLIIDDIYLC
jgi:hypothetical protein